jgi:hypothetical protein
MSAQAELNFSSDSEHSFVVFWYAERDDGYDNDPQFRASLLIDDTQVYSRTLSTTTPNPVTEPTMITIQFEFGQFSTSDGTSIEIYLEYNGWEDMDFYYDNVTFASGWNMWCDALVAISIDASRNSVDLAILDLLFSDWQGSDYVIASSIKEGGTDWADYVLEDPTIFQGDIINIDNFSFPLVIFSWENKHDDGKYGIYCYVAYNNWSQEHALSKIAIFSTPEEEDIVTTYALPMMIIIVAAVAGILFYKKVYIPNREGKDAETSSAAYEMEKMKMVMILALIGGILMTVSLGLIWHTIEMESDVGGQKSTMEMEYGLFEGTMGNVTASYSDMRGPVGDTYTTTSYMVILGVIFSFLTFLFLLLKNMGKIGFGFPMFAIVVLLAFLFSILAPLYLMTALPGAWKDSGAKGAGFDENFQGEKKGQYFGVEVNSTYGPSTGWYIALVAGIINLLALIFFYLGKDEL